MARLVGFDDQIDEDGMRLAKPEPFLLRAIPRRLTYSAADAAPVTADAFKVARYACQQGYAMVPLDPMYAPPGVAYDMTTHTVRVLYLRYRRRQ